jgi:DNA repair ATPase RecN
MIKEDSYKIKFEKLDPWKCDIFQAVKKDLRNEHLLKSPAFIQKYFPKRSLDKLTIEEFSGAYLNAVAEGDEELGERIVTRWVLKNAELYQFFVTELSKINPKYDEIESLSPEVSSFLLNTSVGQFGASVTYIFCVLNAVAFTEEQLVKLREMAIVEKTQMKPQEEKRSFESVETVREHYEREMRKLTEKYEKRMQGMERKYVQDVEGLKKQIAQLHKKLRV